MENELNENGAFLRHHSNPSPMEGKTSKRKTYQEGKMDAANEKVLKQKMLKCTEAQVEVFEKVIGHDFEIEKEEAEKKQG